MPTKSSNVNVTIRVDRGLKRKADALFSDMGMSFTTAVNIFIKQAVREGRIPFEINTAAGAEKFDYAAAGLSEEMTE